MLSLCSVCDILISGKNADVLHPQIIIFISNIVPMQYRGYSHYSLICNVVPIKSIRYPHYFLNSNIVPMQCMGYPHYFLICNVADPIRCM